MLDLFAQGRLPNNFIEITPELGSLFAGYWDKVMPPERLGNMALPFFHLRSSNFWHLVPVPGQEAALQATRQVDTLSQLNKLVLGAQLDHDLFELLQNAERRNALRTVLIQTYFAPELQSILLGLSDLNLQSFIYSQNLIERARKQIKETLAKEDEYVAARDQGFRRAIIRIYENRCAFCGVRMLTTEGRTAVDAAHIVPWSISHNDDVHNGMALCRLCHWTFDEGLATVSKHYAVELSGELRITQNYPGHLLTLEGRTILEPGEQTLWPEIEALKWHKENVFRRR